MQCKARACYLGKPQDRRVYVNEGSSMKAILKRLWNEEEGQDLTEYALLLVLLALAAVTALKGLATALSGVFTNAATNLNTQGT
jgi:pilus assembly protein Flp/PilA